MRGVVLVVPPASPDAGVAAGAPAIPPTAVVGLAAAIAASWLPVRSFQFPDARFHLKRERWVEAGKRSKDTEPERR